MWSGSFLLISSSKLFQKLYGLESQCWWSENVLGEWLSWSRGSRPERTGYRPRKIQTCSPVFWTDTRSLCLSSKGSPALIRTRIFIWIKKLQLSYVLQGCFPAHLVQPTLSHCHTVTLSHCHMWCFNKFQRRVREEKIMWSWRLVIVLQLLYLHSVTGQTLSCDPACQST